MHRYRLLLQRRLRLVTALAVAIGLAGVVVGGWTLERSAPVVSDFNSCIQAGFAAVGDPPQTCSDGRRTFVDTVGLAAVSQSAITSPAPVVKLQSYQILVSATLPRVVPAVSTVITNQADWRQFWQTLHASIVPSPPLLPVDFGRDSVVAIVAAPGSGPGYGLEMTGIVAGGSGLIVNYDLTQPGAGCRPAGPPVSAYLLVATAKDLAGPPKFVPTSHQHRCG